MMSIDLFKTILELRSQIYSDINSSKKKTIKTIYDYYKLKKFINKNILKEYIDVTYQFIYTFISSIRLLPTERPNIEKRMLTNYKILMKDQINHQDNSLVYFCISFLVIPNSTEENPSILYEYSIHPVTSPGEIKFEYTRIYPTKDIHESKTFINSLKLDPYKDNLYTKSAKHFSAANDKMNEVIKIFFKYYIDETKKIIMENNKLLRFIWRGTNE